MVGDCPAVRWLVAHQPMHVVCKGGLGLGIEANRVRWTACQLDLSTRLCLLRLEPALVDSLVAGLLCRPGQSLRELSAHSSSLLVA